MSIFFKLTRILFLISFLGFYHALTVVKLNASPSASLASRPSAAAAQAIFTACVSPAM